ncbi:hypothetical protein ACTWPF_08580 [Oceanobacillus sp. M65]|jgi:hypothetical protein|uniref:RNA polymerase subunit sigma-70 n=1 Tax=Oceanobacillus jordanicus TaxID=2867266 RepID=A0AAW5BC41_9BACI|nr:hypothetical protein [Oceanobacillus jordanicus]MCG3420708.1 hypothetical protein [Oceanobacillus jordanicus]
MRYGEKQWTSANNKELFGVNLHRFVEMEGHANHMEIAHEFGISLGEVKMLKKKLNRA